jgi:hypothetical protein
VTRSYIALAVTGLVGFIVLVIPAPAAVEAVGGVLLVGSLIMVILLIAGRFGPQSQPDRFREEAAREEFSRTGRWPET